MYKIESALLDKKFSDGLSNYTQANCQVTLTDNGFRIYRPPNLTVSANGNTMWGGLRIRNTSNQLGLIDGHTYIVLFDINGQTTNNATSMGWNEQMGWGNGNVRPAPTNVEYDWVGSNFNGKKTCWYKCTISDGLYKTCTEANTNTSFVVGTTYLSYADFMFGFGYESTGSLGTDLYITNIKMYDITNNPNFKVEKYAQMQSGSIIENSSKTIVNVASEINANSFIEI